MRRLLPVLGGLILVASLGGCTVPAGGFTAVAVDESGSPVALVVMCKGRIDGLSLYVADGPDQAVARLEAAVPVTTTARVALASPGTGWTVTTPLAPLTEGARYMLYGWTRSNEWSSDAVDFTTADLRGLRPGQVLRQVFDENRQDIVDTVTDASEFLAHACDDFEA